MKCDISDCDDEAAVFFNNNYLCGVHALEALGARKEDDTIVLRRLYKNERNH